MIKFSRNDTDKARAAVRSLCKAKASNTTYNTPEVNAALVEMFHGKCYICENKRVSSFQIEHLRTHKRIQCKVTFKTGERFCPLDRSV